MFKELFEAESALEKSKRIFVSYAMEKISTLDKKETEDLFTKFWDTKKGQSLDSFVTYVKKGK